MDSSISIRRVLRRTANTYAGQATVLLSVSAIAVAVVAVIDTLLTKGSLAPAIVALIVDLATITLFTGAVVQLAADALENGPVKSAGQLLRAIMPVFGQLILVGIVAGIAISFLFTAASLLFLAFTISAILSGGSSVGGIIVVAVVGTILLLAPGALLLTIWSVIVPVVVLERPGRLRALGRSRALVRGNRWRVFAMIALLAIPLGIASHALELVGGAAGHGPALVAKTFVAILVAPIPLLAATALYFELRGVAASNAPTTATPPYPPTTDPLPPGTIPPSPA